MGDGPDPPAGTPESTEREVARLAEERDRLEAEVGALRAQVANAARPPRRVRRVVAVVLVVVTTIVFTVAVVGVWTRRNALNTDKWVDTVGPIAEDPAVQQALGSWMTTELMTAIDPETFFESVLPEQGQALAGPLTSALRGFVNDRVDTFLASDTFQRLWVEINRRAHTRVVAVLEGDTGNLQIENGKVDLNLVPVLNTVLAEIGKASPEIFGRTVDLPTVSVDDIPEDAVSKVENALGVDLPDNFGQFTVFEAERLEAIQDAVELFDRLVVVAVVLAFLLIALTLWVSPSRRRTLLQLAVGIALGVVLIRRIGLRAEDEVVDLAKPENREAVGVVVGAFIDSLLDATAWILAAAALVAVVALLTGPYPWAVALRRRTASLARALAAAVGAATTRRPDEATVAWVVERRELLQLGGAVVGIVVLLLVDLSWLWILLLALVIAAYELAVVRIAKLTPSEPEPSGAVETP
ncbi:MAG TPA: hypothetical protein VFR26_11155 [Acidimicrobiales bacterium]|nr:hypothetical protein [Acidimicrobiales bacterium]